MLLAKRIDGSLICPSQCWPRFIPFIVNLHATLSRGEAGKTDLEASIKTASRIVPGREEDTGVLEQVAQRHLYLRSFNE